MVQVSTLLKWKDKWETSKSIWMSKYTFNWLYFTILITHFLFCNSEVSDDEPEGRMEFGRRETMNKRTPDKEDGTETALNPGDYSVDYKDKDDPDNMYTA